MMAMVAAAFTLPGCAGSFSIPPTQPAPVVAPPGDKIEVLGANGQPTEIVEPARDPLKCFARARGFQGLVQVPCDIATSIRP